jgi:hypothetical protein
LDWHRDFAVGAPIVVLFFAVGLLPLAVFALTRPRLAYKGLFKSFLGSDQVVGNGRVAVAALDKVFVSHKYFAVNTQVNAGVENFI